MTTTLTVSKQDQIVTITFNRPEAMNTLNDVMAEELLDVVREIESDNEIKVVVLRGEGPLFMAGGDVGYFYKNLDNLDQHINTIIEKVHDVIKMIYEMPKIVIACVHGSVAGIGMSFMLAADLVIAAEETKFTLAYSRIFQHTFV